MTEWSDDASCPADADEDEVTDALLALSRVFVGLAARSLARVDDDVTLPQFRTLVVLVARGPQRVIDLAQELSVTSSTATRMCNRLVGKGLVARQVRPDDRRAAWITLTAAGRDLVGTVMRHRREAIADLVAELDLTRPIAFAATVHALVEAAGELPTAQWQRRWEASASHNYVHHGCRAAADHPAAPDATEGAGPDLIHPGRGR